MITTEIPSSPLHTVFLPINNTHSQNLHSTHKYPTCLQFIIARMCTHTHTPIRCCRSFMISTYNGKIHIGNFERGSQQITKNTQNCCQFINIPLSRYIILHLSNITIVYEIQQSEYELSKQPEFMCT